MAHFSDRLDQAIQKLKSLNMLTTELKDAMAQFHESHKKRGQSLKKDSSAPLQNIIILAQTTRSLERYNQQLRASLGRIISLHTGLEKIALYHGNLKELSIDLNMEEIEFWPLIWMAPGIRHGNATAAHRCSQKIFLGDFSIITRFPPYLRPRLSLIIPAEAIQIQALTGSVASTRSGRRADRTGWADLNSFILMQTYIG